MVECLQFMYNWKIRVTNKTVTFSTSGMKQGIRGNKLGEGYGKADLVERIAKVVAERNAEKEARRIAEEVARVKAEALAREEAARKEKQLQEEQKQRELLARKENWHLTEIVFVRIIVVKSLQERTGIKTMWIICNHSL